MGPDYDLSAYDREGCIVDLSKFDHENMVSKKWPTMIVMEAEKAAAAEARKKEALAKAAEAKKEEAKDEKCEE